jgi:enoyl-CoA hydratase/carnithine racemase
MAYVETEQRGPIWIVRLCRPERLNALGTEMRREAAAAWRRFRDDEALEVAILTGTGRAFCAGEDMKESLERGAPGVDREAIDDPFLRGDPARGDDIRKPIIAAINGFAMGGGFLLVERADLRVAVRGAVFEMSEAKRWLLGGYQHGHIAALPHPVATEMAFAFRLDAERLHALGFINRLVEPDRLMAEAIGMAEHLMTLPPASRVNTLTMMRAMRPQVSDEILELARRLRAHGAQDDLMESRRAFAEKRPPKFRGWDHAGDRARTPTLATLRAESESE